MQPASATDHVLQKQNGGQCRKAQAENSDTNPASGPDRLPRQGLVRSYGFAHARGRWGISGMLFESGSYDVALGDLVVEVQACETWRTDCIAAHKQAQLPWLDRIKIAFVVEEDQRALRKVWRILGMKEGEGFDLLRG